MDLDTQGYLEGNAGRGETHENNREAFKKWALIPNRLVKTIAPSLGVNILGFDMPFPLMLAPVGVLKIFHADKEVGVAQVANELGVAYTLSTASATSIEEAAEANGSVVGTFLRMVSRGSPRATETAFDSISFTGRQTSTTA